MQISTQQIEHVILQIRGQKVILDRDLAHLYGVETKVLKRAVERNASRFPRDFMFQLTKEEYAALRCHFGALKRGQHSKYLPRVFTEEGVAMLSGVLRSKRAIQINVAIMRAFVRLRETLSLHKELAQKLIDIERKIENHDESIQNLFETIRQLMEPPEPVEPKEKEKEMGFHMREGPVPYRINKTKHRKTGI